MGALKLEDRKKEDQKMEDRPENAGPTTGIENAGTKLRTVQTCITTRNC